jgi:RNA polymerase sigma-70 factor (ECF subfamily)
MRNEESVVKRAQNGDPSAWAELYRAHAGRLEVWLRTLAPPDVAASAEDLAAEVWLTAAERAHAFRGADGAFAGWLFGIGRNLAMNSRRRSARRDTSPFDPQSWVEDTVVLPAIDLAVVGDDWVRNALAALPRREREVIACIDVVGLDVAGTAAALEISGVAVRVARHRGLARLRRTVADGSAGVP